MSVAAAAETVGSEEPAVTFEYDANFQSKIAALAIRDFSFSRRCAGLIKPSYFDYAPEGVLVSLAEAYFEKYHCLPGSVSVWTEMIKDSVANRVIRKEMAVDVVKRLRELIKGSVSDRDFVIEKVSEFARHQAVNTAYMDSVDLVERGDFDGAQAIMQKAFNVGASETFDDIDYWNQDHIDARAKMREDIASGKIPKRGIPSGLKKIDALLYHGGWGRQELSCIMGGAKKGKSMGLGYFAGRASLLGYNVLYMTLEVSTSIIADREDACLTSTDMSMLGVSAKVVTDKLAVYKGKENKPGELRMVGFPSGTLTCRQIRRVLEKYKGDGIKFDLLVVDYADIMAPDNYIQDTQENSRTIWLGLRSIAQEEDLACLTATQTNREGYKEATAKAEHAADDFNKIRIADLVLSINHSDEERSKGEARLFVAANRNGAGEFTLHIKQDMSKMQFITAITGLS